MDKLDNSTYDDVERELQNHANTLKAQFDRIDLSEGDCSAHILLSAFVLTYLSEAKAHLAHFQMMRNALEDTKNKSKRKCDGA